PGIWGPVFAAATGAGIAVMRLGLEPAAGIAWRPLAAVGQLLLTASWRRAARGAPLPRHADHFRGFALTGRRDFLERLLAVLDHLEAGVSELMVHPGYPESGLGGWGRWRAGRAGGDTTRGPRAIRRRGGGAPPARAVAPARAGGAGLRRRRTQRRARRGACSSRLPALEAVVRSSASRRHGRLP